MMVVYEVYYYYYATLTEPGRVTSASAHAYVIILRLGLLLVHTHNIINHSLGLPAADILPSPFEIDVEEDPVVDVCRRNDRRGRSPVLA